VERTAKSANQRLSGQLTRRSVDVHFCRYRADNPQDRKTSLNVLCSFERQMRRWKKIRRSRWSRWPEG
jgi:hypothetical protein